jgi:hypothetical protein
VIGLAFVFSVDALRRHPTGKRIVSSLMARRLAGFDGLNRREARADS